MFIRKYFGNIPDRIGLHANDVNIAKYVAYVNELNIVCYDTAGLRPINADKLEDLYTKGLLLSNGGLFYTPTSMIKGEETLISFIRYNSVSNEIEYVSASSSEEIEIPVLSALSIGNKTLTPAFDPEILAYTLSTEDASDILTLDVFPDDSIVTVTLGETVLEDYAEGITWADGENTLTIALEKGNLSTEYVVTVTASLPAPTLSALTIGSLTLSPSFDSGVVAYTAATTDASNILTFTTVPNDAPVVVKLGDEPITTYSEGIEWAAGANILTITVGEAPAAVTYTVTVTAS
jgi:hypothetical protein